MFRIKRYIPKAIPEKIPGKTTREFADIDKWKNSGKKTATISRKNLPKFVAKIQETSTRKGLETL